MEQAQSWLTILAAPVSGLLGVAIGAVVTSASSFRIELRKYRREVQSVSVALAAAVETDIWIADRRRHADFFRTALETLRQGHAMRFFGGMMEGQISDPIADHLMDRVGILEPDLAARTTRFFTALHGIRGDVMNLRNGVFGDDPATVAMVIEADLALWQETREAGLALVVDLRKSAAET